MNAEDMKRLAGVRAVDFVENGMTVGLGTGSTVYYTLLDLARRMKEDGLHIIGIPTSKATEKIAAELGIPLTRLTSRTSIDLTIDGADEVDPDLNLIKGMGGALLREKIIAANSHVEVIIADESKLVKRLGTRSPLPVEVLRFGHEKLGDRFRELGASPVLRTEKNGSRPFITDSDNYIYDLRFTSIGDPFGLESRLNNMPGVVENGLFLNLCHRVVVAKTGEIMIME